jgi:hypothetical protein
MKIICFHHVVALRQGARLKSPYAGSLASNSRTGT